MSHGLELGDNSARKQEVLGTRAERALDLVVDLVRGREVLRDELLKMGPVYRQMETQLKGVEQRAQDNGAEVDRQRLLIEWFRLLLAEAGMGANGKKLTAKGRERAILRALGSRAFQTGQDPEDLDEAIERWMEREAKARGIVHEV